MFFRCSVVGYLWAPLAVSLLFVLPCIAMQANTDDTELAANRVRSESIKLGTMQLLAQGLGEQLQVQTPALTRVSIYIDVRTPSTVLEYVELTLDEQPLVARHYSAQEAQALLGPGHHRIARINVAQGEHKITVNFRSRAPQAKSSDGFSDTLDIYFDKENVPKALILPVAVDTRSITGRVRRWKWQSQSYDARLGFVEFLRATDQRFAALLELLSIRGSVSNANELPVGYYSLVAQCYIDFSMPNAARTALEKARENEPKRSSRDAAGLRLAALDYRQANYAQADRSLDALGPHVSNENYLRWRNLSARNHLAQQHYFDAVTLLSSEARPLAEAPYSYFNLAAALAGVGRTRESYSLLNRLGSLKNTNATIGALKDQANSVLGFAHLELGNAAAAKNAANLVSGNSRFANTATLIKAWSSLLTLETGESNTRSPGEERVVAPLWSTLVQGDALEPITQEARVGYAYALEENGLYSESIQAYHEALVAFEALEGRLFQYRAMLRSGQMPETVFENKSFALADTSWLREMRASFTYQELMQNYEDFLVLQAALADLTNQPTELQRLVLQHGAQAQLVLAQQLLAQAFDSQIQRLASYQIDARLGLARGYAHSP